MHIQYSIHRLYNDIKQQVDTYKPIATQTCAHTIHVAYTYNDIEQKHTDMKLRVRYITLKTLDP